MRTENRHRQNNYTGSKERETQSQQSSALKPAKRSTAPKHKFVETGPMYLDCAPSSVHNIYIVPVVTIAAPPAHTSQP
jgi:hypothetical protein